MEKKIRRFLAIMLTVSIFLMLPGKADALGSGKSGSASASSTQQVTIEEIGIMLSIPRQMKWATRSKGDAEFVGINYNRDSDGLASYMEENGYYIMSVDPESNLRISMIAAVAKYDVKNSISQTDSELLSVLDDLDIGLLPAEISDTWVWRNESTAVTCLLATVGNNWYQLTAITAVDGIFYIFIIRDTDEARLCDAADTVFSGFRVDRENTVETLTMDTCAVSLNLPANWTVLSQEAETVDGTECEYAILDASVQDGTRRIIGLRIVDLYADQFGSYFENIAPRETYDAIYARPQIESFFKQNNLQNVSVLRCGETDFSVFRKSTDVTSASMIAITNGCMISVEWYVPTGDALKDDWLPELQAFVGSFINSLAK